jgi:Na+-driven multidrug efflux pump
MLALFAFGGVAVAVPGTLMRVFIADADVVREGIRFLRIVGPAWGFFGGLMVLQGAFRGAGFTKHAMALSLLSRWVLRIPAMVVLAFPLAWGPAGLWWGWVISSVGSCVVGAAWFARGTWREGVVGDDSGRVQPAADADAADGDPDLG